MPTEAELRKAARATRRPPRPSEARSPFAKRLLTKHAVSWLGKARLAAGFEASRFVQLPEPTRFDWYEVLLTWQFYEWVPVSPQLASHEHLTVVVPREVDVFAALVLNQTSPVPRAQTD